MQSPTKSRYVFRHPRHPLPMSHMFQTAQNANIGVSPTGRGAHRTNDMFLFQTGSKSKHGSACITACKGQALAPFRFHIMLQRILEHPPKEESARQTCIAEGSWLPAHYSTLCLKQRRIPGYLPIHGSAARLGVRPGDRGASRATIGLLAISHLPTCNVKTVSYRCQNRNQPDR